MQGIPDGDGGRPASPAGSVYSRGDMATAVLGIDIGGTGIKGALVDPERGELVGDRYRVDTPSPATPEAVTAVVSEIFEHFSQHAVTGVAYPGSVRHGIASSAAHVDRSFLGVDLGELFSTKLGVEVMVLNDADAAGLAEMRFGAGRDEMGTVLLLTFGTGIGSALFVDGTLVPNTELGHLEFHGRGAEEYAAARARTREGLGYPEWANRVNEYLAHVEMLFSPDMFILGGGVSKKWDRYGHLLSSAVAIRPARLRNNAGIVGAAVFAGHD